jgi:peptidoglycan-binding protein ArfA
VSTSDEFDGSDVPAAGGRSTFRRRRLIIAALVLVLLAVVGWVVSDTDDATTTPGDADSTSQTETTSTPTTTTTTSSVAAPAQLSLNRDGNDITLTGKLPGDTEKSDLESAVKTQWPSAHMIDKIEVAPGAALPDLSGMGGLLAEAGAISDFGLRVNGSDLTFTGTAPNLDIASQVQSTAALVFPNLKITNNLQIPATGAPPMNTADPNVPAPNAPAATNCPTLQADIATLLRTPISFTSGGAQLTGDSRQLVAQIAGKIKTCPGAAVTVVGYTDNIGSEAVNQSLSALRAKAVAAELVSSGVAADHVSSSGAGSANPIATNDTPAGRAQNRRVAITVS